MPGKQLTVSAQAQLDAIFPLHVAVTQEPAFLGSISISILPQKNKRIGKVIILSISFWSHVGLCRESLGVLLILWDCSTTAFHLWSHKIPQLSLGYTQM